MKVKMGKSGPSFLFVSVVLLSASGCENGRGGWSGRKEPDEANAQEAPVATSSPIEAWVLSDKRVYRPGDPVQLTLKLVNRTERTVRLPVPAVCVNGSGWGVLEIDLLVNGRKYTAECHTPDVVQIEGNGEAAWRIIMRDRQWPLGWLHWSSPGHFSVYSVWHRTDVSAQTDNDFLGPIVSHPAEFDITLSEKSEHRK